MSVTLESKSDGTGAILKVNEQVSAEFDEAGMKYSGAQSGLQATNLPGAIDEAIANMSMGVNDIINGQFQIAQTGTEFVSPVSGEYDLDGWIRNGVGGTVTITRVAGSVTGSYARESNVTTAKATLATGDFEIVNTRLLGYDCVKYLNTAFVVALRVKSSLTGIHCIALQASNSSFVHEINILAADTWQDVIVPVPTGVPGINSSTNAWGIILRITQAAGTTFQTATTDEWVTGSFFGTANQVNGLSTVGNKLTIEDVRINLGTVPLPNVTPYDAELARCRRYVQPLPTSFLVVSASTSSIGIRGVPLAPTMNSTPSAEITSALSLQNYIGAPFTQSATSLGSNFSSITSALFVSVGNFTGLTADRAYHVTNGSVIRLLARL